MSRLIDKLILANVSDIPKESDFHAKRRWPNALKKSPVIVLDNVAEYFYRNNPDMNTGQILKEWGIFDFPNVAPPFSEMFCEFRVPNNISKNTALSSDGHSYPLPKSIGVAFTAFDSDKIEKLPSVHPLTVFMAQFLSGTRNLDTSQIRWILFAALFVQFEDWCSGPEIEWAFCLNPQGQVTRSPNQGIVSWSSAAKLSEEEEDQQKTYFSLLMASYLYPCLLGLSFMHCKNVKNVAQEHPPKLSKAYQRRYGNSLIVYHTLEIDPMKKVLREEGQSETLGLKKALHITRGHFANYTEGKGLFGKYHGTYWRPPHVKGSAEHGVVKKDYSIKAPE